MLERAALAVLVHAGASSWLAVGVAGVCWLASLCCHPYWSRAEDLLDGMTRMTTFLTCLAAALVEAEVLEGDEVWLAAILNTVGIGTLLALVIFIGPLRLMRGAIKSYLAMRRINRVKGGIGTNSKMSEAEALKITEEEFSNYSDVAKYELTWKFPELPVLQHYKEHSKPVKFAFDNMALKGVVRDWCKFSVETEAVFGHISEWDVSAVSSMDGLFQYMSRFNDDISLWDVSNVKSMAYMFNGASMFDQNIGAWDTSNVKAMGCMFQGASKFNQNIGAWDTSNVTNMTGMFWGFDMGSNPKDLMLSLVRIMIGFDYAFEGFGLGSWEVSNVKSMMFMFMYASKFDQDISSWDVSNVENIFGMFFGASSFNKDYTKDWVKKP